MNNQLRFHKYAILLGLVIYGTLALAQPKVLFTGIDDAGSGTEEGFSFVAVCDILETEKIYFTEDEYESGTGNFATNNGTNANESHLEYTPPAGGLSVGDVIKIVESGTNIFTITGGGSVTNVGGFTFGISQSGEELYAYSASNAASPWNSVTEIHAWFMNTDLPITDFAAQNPSTDYPNVVVQYIEINDGCNFTDANRSGAVIADLANSSKWANQNMTTTVFTGGTLCPAMAVPEMDLVDKDGDAIEDGGSNSPSSMNDTDFGDACLTGESVIKAYTIQNNGTSALNLNGSPLVSIGGTHASDFTVLSQPTSPISGPGSTTFTIKFDPSDSGIRSATVSIANDDSDENPYNFNIQGTGITSATCPVDENPRIAFVGLENNGNHAFGFVAICDIPDGATFYFTEDEYASGSGNFETPNESHLSYTVPTGGLNEGDVVVITEIGTNTFSVSGAGGTASNVGGFNFQLSDFGEELYAYSASDNTAPWSSVTSVWAWMINSTAPIGDFSDQNPSSDFPNALIQHITINDDVDFKNSERTNTVLSDLSITANFQVATTLIDLSFITPMLCSASQDPEIAIEDVDGDAIVDGSTSPMTFNDTEFGNICVEGERGNKTYVIQNLGSGNLNLNGSPKVDITGSDAADFSVLVQPTSPLSIGSSITFSVQFNPSSSGTKMATVSIANDDADENPYTFAIQGNGVENASCPCDETPSVLFTGIDGNDPDAFGFVAVCDIAEGDKIYFTEDEYLSGSGKFATNVGSNQNESHLEYTSPMGGLSEGDVVIITETAPNVFTVSGAGGTATNVGGFNFLLANSAEELYAYRASDPASPWNSVTAIYAWMINTTASLTDFSGQNPSSDFPGAAVQHIQINSDVNFKDASRTNTVQNDLTLTSNFDGTSTLTNTSFTNPDLCPFSLCPSIGTVTLNPLDACPGAMFDVTVSGLTLMSMNDNAVANYGIEIVYFTSTPSDPYVGGTSLGTVPFGSLSMTNTEAILTGASIPNAGLHEIYAILSPIPSDICCRPFALKLTAQDTVSPIAACQDITVFLDGAGNASITAADLDNGSSDDCGPVSLQASVTSFTCADLGPNNVVLTVTDGSSNSRSCTATVTVVDTTKPTAVCQNITVYLDGAGNASITAADLDNGSSDNCGAVSLQASVTSFTCADLGPNNVVLTVTDGSSNSRSCTTTVTVVDTTSPKITCPGNQVENPNASCQFVLPDYTGLATPSDNCAIPTVTQSPVAGTVINGTTTITMTANDGNGQTKACTFDVILNDATPPSAVCQNITVYLDGAGNASITAADLDGGSTDNCSAVTLSASQTAFTCADLGPNNVTLTATDGNTNTDNCTAVVTIADTISPSAVCQNITVYLDGAGNASITAADLDNGSSDNCGSIMLHASVTSFTCADLGPNNVLLTVTDGSSNSRTCMATVTVVDTTKPTAICQNITVYLDGAGNASITPGDIDNGSSDNCSIASLSASPSSFTCANLGPNNVVLTVTDGSTNSRTCMSTVTVVDTTSPTAVCQNITVYLDEAGNASITAADIDNGSSDNCSIASLSASPSSFTCANLGPNMVTLTITDGSGNMKSCNATVTVADTTSPTAVCQNITVYLNAAGNVSISAADIDNGSSDNCGSVTLGASTTAFTCADLGPNDVTLTATDGSSNTKTCTSTVTVADTTSPVAICQDITVQLDAAGTVSIAAIDVDNGSNDACGIASLAIDKDMFTCADIGSNTVTMTVMDNNGNSAMCTSNVTVEDMVAPVAICKDITVQLDAAGQVTIVAADVDNGSNDACGIASLALDKDMFTCTDIGSNTVTMTVMDNNGNSAMCTSNVTVEDMVAPVAVCKDITIQLDAAGQVTIVAADIDNGSNDACGIASLALDKDMFACADIGSNTVTMTVMDNNGNSAMCTSNVTVEDKVAPVAICKDITVNLNADGTFEITPEMIDNGSSDNCGIQDMTVDKMMLNCDNIGDNTIILMVTDQNGNTAQCPATVTVDEVLISTVPNIIGMSPICPGLSGVPYSVTADPDVNSYEWTYSGTGATINNNGSADITIDFAPDATGGILTVKYANICGTTDLTDNFTISKASSFTCSIANSCLNDNLLVLNTMIGFPGSINLFKASTSVSSFATIPGNETVIFRAGQEINLFPNFEVKYGALFLAEIEGCFDVLQTDNIKKQE